jgi:ATP adenylyltransferase
VKHLWAPWRLAYIKRAGPIDEACIFCTLPPKGRDREHLILHQGPLTFAMLNAFPYNSGHLMVVPRRHLADPAGLTDAEALELHHLTAAAMQALRETYHPEGFNIGLNVGRAAGAGILGHLHVHVVPRWVGDTNYMPVLGEVKVLPEDLTETYDRLAAALRSVVEHQPRT